MNMVVVTPLPSMDTSSWKRVQERLRAEVGDNVYGSWFARMDLESVDGDVITLSVVTRFLKSWITSHYLEKVLSCIQAEYPHVTEAELIVRSAALRPLRPEVLPVATHPFVLAHNGHKGGRDSWSPVPEEHARQLTATIEAPGGSPLEPRFSFETFVVGRTNAIAQAAVRQVAQARRGDQVMFNPLYIHASVGLGKTHLLQALAWAGASAEKKVLYLTAEKFMYGFVAAMRAQNPLAFREILRAIDALVIDDLQFLQGKTAQLELCHTLNSFIDAGRQVVVSADRPVNELENIDERVRSRFVGGLVVEIGPLGEGQRLEILEHRAVALKQHTPGFKVSGAVLEYIARVLASNGRDLEGALNRLRARSQLAGEPVTLEMAVREVQDLIRPSEPKRVKVEDIQRIVARQYNVSRTDLLSSRRTQNVVRPRQVAMYLAKTLTLRSLPEIGRRFGGRDHTTVLHAVRKIENLVNADTSLAEEVEILKRQLL